MPQIGPLEIVVIFVVALLVFGPAKLPEIGRQVGRGLGELRKFQATVRKDLDEVMRVEDDDEEPTPVPKLPPKAAAEAEPLPAADPVPAPVTKPQPSPEAGPPAQPTD